VILGAWLVAVCRVRAGQATPRLARTLSESTLPATSRSNRYRSSDGRAPVADNLRGRPDPTGSISTPLRMNVGLDHLYAEGEPRKDVVQELDGGVLVELGVDAQTRSRVQSSMAVNW
jgi:hypothetical protein